MAMGPTGMGFLSLLMYVEFCFYKTHDNTKLTNTCIFIVESNQCCCWCATVSVPRPTSYAWDDVPATLHHHTRYDGCRCNCRCCSCSRGDYVSEFCMWKVSVIWINAALSCVTPLLIVKILMLQEANYLGLTRVHPNLAVVDMCKSRVVALGCRNPFFLGQYGFGAQFVCWEDTTIESACSSSASSDHTEDVTDSLREAPWVRHFGATKDDFEHYIQWYLQP